MNAPASPFSLAGRRILVTGATGALGRAAALAAARLGADLVVAGRRPDALSAVAEACRTAGAPTATPWAGDLAEPEARDRLARESGELDGLLVASGITLVKPFRVGTAADWQRVIDTNLSATVFLTHALLRANRFRPGASLLYLASIAARLGAPAHAFYSASKGGLVAFVRTLALELAPRGIRANTISPGLVRTPMADQMAAGLTEAQAEEYARQYPLGLGEPDDVAHLACYLLSPAARWVTGQDWAIDGGLSIR